MSFEEAIKTIIELNEEIKAVKILMGCIERNTDKIESENAEMSSCLTAIKKINKSKNDAIDALCERSRQCIVRNSCEKRRGRPCGTDKRVVEAMVIDYQRAERIRLRKWQ